MGNCCTKPVASSPAGEFSRQDAIILLLGPVGAETISFAEGATRQGNLNDSQVTLQSPSKAQIRTLETDIPDLQKRVILLIPTLFDGNKITEHSIIDEVKPWLNERRPGYPHLDYILYFNEAGRIFNIQLAHVGSYLSKLQDICGANDARTLCSKVTLVTTPGGYGIPEEWGFLDRFGARKFVFERSAESAVRLINQIIDGERQKV